MTGFPLPRFSYHEALLIGDFFLQDFAFLELRNEPKPSDEEGLEELAEEFRKTPRYQKTYTYVEKALGRFKKFLDSLKTAGTYLHDVDKVALVQKLEELNESQRVQLYFAVTRYYWTDGTESQAGQD